MTAQPLFKADALGKREVRAHWLGPFHFGYHVFQVLGSDALSRSAGDDSSSSKVCGAPAGSSCSIREAAALWTALELAQLQARLAVVNEWGGEEVLRFEPAAGEGAL